MSDRIQPYDLTACPYCGKDGYTLPDGTEVEECVCTYEQREQIDSMCKVPHLHTYHCTCIPSPSRTTGPDYEVLEDLVEKESLPYHPMGENLDSWGCSSKERTLFSDNKRKGSRIRKMVRRRVEVERFVSA